MIIRLSCGCSNIAAPDGTTLVEADGDSYTDYERFSVFTGIPPTVGGTSGYGVVRMMRYPAT